MTRAFYQLWDELLSEIINQAEEMKVGAFYQHEKWDLNQFYGIAGNFRCVKFLL